jgi:hypothetical protein
VVSILQLSTTSPASLLCTLLISLDEVAYGNKLPCPSLNTLPFLYPAFDTSSHLRLSQCLLSSSVTRRRAPRRRYSLRLTPKMSQTFLPACRKGCVPSPHHRERTCPGTPQTFRSEALCTEVSLATLPRYGNSHDPSRATDYGESMYSPFHTSIASS